MHTFATTIPARLFATATSFPDEVFLQQRQGESLTSLTYSDVRKLVEELRDHLLCQGFSRGDRIALLSENSREWIVIYFAILAAGFVAVPLDSGMPLGDLCNILQASGSRMLFASEKYYAPIQNVLAHHNIALRIARTEENLAVDSCDVSVPELNPADIAVLIYTSGTTGHSKGVALTHDNLLSNVESCALVCEIHQVDNFLLILPLHHTFACTVSLLLPMAMGSRVTLATSYRSRDIIDDIRISKTTVLAAVPQLFDGMMNGVLRSVDSAGKLKQVIFALLRMVSRSARFLGFHLGHSLFKSLRAIAGVDSVRLFVSGGAALPPETNRFFEELGMNLTQGYGMTECSPVLAVNPATKNKIGSVGPALPGISLMINAPDGNGVGEVWTAGANVMQGYYNNPDATRAIMSGEWLRTGDLGFLDSDGYLFLTGRMKNLIVTHAGKNVYPEEIETKLVGDLAIAEALVIAPKRSSREPDTLCCLVRPNLEHIAAHHPHDRVEKVIEHAIRKYNEHVPAYQKIREWKIIEEFKKTSTGKIKRFLYTDEFK